METIIKDIRFGVRSLLKRPGFAVITILTLALGIGANTAIFSVVNSVVLRPLPYLDSDRLFQVNDSLSNFEFCNPELKAGQWPGSSNAVEKFAIRNSQSEIG